HLSQRKSADHPLCDWPGQQHLHQRHDAAAAMRNQHTDLFRQSDLRRPRHDIPEDRFGAECPAYHQMTLDGLDGLDDGLILRIWRQTGLTRGVYAKDALQLIASKKLHIFCEYKMRDRL